MSKADDLKQAVLDATNRVAALQIANDAEEVAETTTPPTGFSVPDTDVDAAISALNSLAAGTVPNALGAGSAVASPVANTPMLNTGGNAPLKL